MTRRVPANIAAQQGFKAGPVPLPEKPAKEPDAVDTKILAALERMSAGLAEIKPADNTEVLSALQSMTASINAMASVIREQSSIMQSLSNYDIRKVSFDITERDYLGRIEHADITFDRSVQ